MFALLETKNEYLFSGRQIPALWGMEWRSLWRSQWSVASAEKQRLISFLQKSIKEKEKAIREKESDLECPDCLETARGEIFCCVEPLPSHHHQTQVRREECRGIGETWGRTGTDRRGVNWSGPPALCPKPLAGQLWQGQRRNRMFPVKKILWFVLCLFPILSVEIEQ